MTNEFREKNGLKPGESPTLDLLNKAGFSEYVAALGYRNIHINDVYESAGLNANEFNEILRIGKEYHDIAEKILVEYFRGKGCKAFNEVNVNRDRDTRSDVVLLLDKKAQALSDDMKYLVGYKHQKLLIIDVMLGSSEKDIQGHCTRRYQDKERMLYLVSSQFHVGENAPRDVPFSNHIKIFTPEEFTKKIGMDGVSARNFVRAGELARDASFRGKEYEKRLTRLSNEAKAYMKQHFPEGTKDFHAEIENNPQFGEHVLRETKDKSLLDAYVDDIQDKQEIS